MSEPKVDETKPSETKPKRMVRRSVAIALGIICIIIIAGLVGVVAYSLSTVNDKNSIISSLNTKISQLDSFLLISQDQYNNLYTVAQLKETYIPFEDKVVGANSSWSLTFLANYSGLIIVSILAPWNYTDSSNTFVELSYSSNGWLYGVFNYSEGKNLSYQIDKEASGWLTGSAAFPVLPANIVVRVVNNSTNSDMHAFIVYYY